MATATATETKTTGIFIDATVRVGRAEYPVAISAPNPPRLPRWWVQCGDWFSPFSDRKNIAEFDDTQLEKAVERCRQHHLKHFPGVAPVTAHLVGVSGRRGGTRVHASHEVFRGKEVCVYRVDGKTFRQPEFLVDFMIELLLIGG